MNLKGNEAIDELAAGIDRLVLFGPPGTGKTYAGLTQGDVSGGAHRLICNEDMTSADVTGHFMPTAEGNWKWHEGSVLKAWKGDGQRGGRVVADEIDRASGDVLSVLLNMFDTVESASWHHPETGVIDDAKFKTFGCGSAIASSSLATEWLKGKTVDEALAIKNTDIVQELNLPPVKIHCSVLAEDAIKAALADYQKKSDTK